MWYIYYLGSAMLTWFMHWYQYVYLIKTFHQSHKLLDIKIKLLHSMYSHYLFNINCGVYFEVEIYLDGLLKRVTIHKTLVVNDLKTMGRHFGWILHVLYSILYKECQSIIYYNTNVANYYNIYVYNVHNNSPLLAHLTKFFTLHGHKSLNTKFIWMAI